jgi:hypothetical protein
MKVRVLLDLSPDAIEERSKKHGVKFWQLRTPLTSMDPTFAMNFLGLVALNGRYRS